MERNREAGGERAGHSYFLWDAGGKRCYGWEEKSSKMVPMTEHGGICFCPSCAATMPRAAASEAAAYQPAGRDGGGAASRVSLWGAVFLFSFSVTLHNVR